jgi:alpha-glucosidase
VDSVEAALPAGAWPNYVLGNHDVHRIASRVGPGQDRVAMMLLLTLRGTPTVYYGDEIGMHDVEIPPELIQDPVEKRIPGHNLGRDPERTPMQWDASPNAGFCAPGVEPWLPVAGDYRAVNVAVESDDPRSMLSFTRALTGIRRAHPALTDGSYRPVDGRPGECFVYLRELADQRLLIALNLSDTDQTIGDSTLGAGSIVLSTHLDREGQVDLASLSLRPNEGCIVELKHQR